MNLIRRLIIFSVIIFSAACAEVRPQGPDSSDTSPPDVNPSESPSPAVFPHPKDWSDPASHGVWIRQFGFGACLECHKKTSLSDESPPACGSCHSLYPHSKDWAEKENHGATALAEGKGTCATQCHGSDLNGGLSGVSCRDCHTVYPHAIDWRRPEQHGLTAKGSGKEVCKGCHGDDLQGGDPGVSCYQCHTVYPHSNNWADKEVHGVQAIATGKVSCTTQCHGSDLKGGLSGVSCNDCHTIYPHEGNWRDAAKHGLAAKGNGKEACKDCHGADLTGSDSGISCYKCHSVYPHPGNWADQEAHGAQAILSDKVACATQCHGDDLKGGLSGVSCNQCHNDYPHADPDWVAIGRSNLHAKTFIKKMTEGKIDACSECHGTNYDRTVGGARCTACHPNGVTHRAEWSEGSQHGKYFSGHFSAVSTEAFCEDCHGAAVGFKDDQTKTFLAGQADCYGCHWAYPHQSYEVPGIGVSPWEPAANTPSGLGHNYYLMRSDLVSDAAGNAPVHINDSVWIPALQNTCGGSSGGSCHFNGYRSSPTGSTSAACGQYCHRSKPPWGIDTTIRTIPAIRAINIKE